MIALMLLYYSFYIYLVVFIIYIVVQFFKKKKLPWVLLSAQVLTIAIFFYLQNLVDNHKLIFTGNYKDSTEHWADGMANVYVSFANLGILLLIFIVLQIGFWYFFNKQLKQLNTQELVNHFFEKNE